jgi:DNA-binding XRE family transcriptional regulator
VNKPTRTTTPGGEQIVILPAADYERLVELAEDAHDIALAERILAELKSGKQEAFTQEEVLELLNAPSPVGFWRKRRGLTQAALAKAAGIGKTALTAIERGEPTIDVRVYRRLAAELDVELDELLPNDPPARVLPKAKSRKR